MGRRLQPSRNVDYLARQLETIWQEIPLHTIRNLYQSRTRRVAACIQASRGPTSTTVQAGDCSGNGRVILNKADVRTIAWNSTARGTASTNLHGDHCWEFLTKKTSSQDISYETTEETDLCIDSQAAIKFVPTPVFHK
ncbi:hypothetical protein LAZ67_2001386 [Cordylochernes scorpioides]|uniref:Uncharacterized protein n=1 Tax=Cordylochernes scorpioides TaxID=51811 RepID=A0ABY6K167_9ARAC|nr:hypothetical protein LAZ67_2001386 [Cordylochernes scorpioides]